MNPRLAALVLASRSVRNRALTAWNRSRLCALVTELELRFFAWDAQRRIERYRQAREFHQYRAQLAATQESAARREATWLAIDQRTREMVQR